MKFSRDNKNNIRIIFSWSANTASNIPIIMAFSGLFFSLIILTYGSCNNNKIYHDFSLINKKDLIDSTITERTNKIKHIYDSLSSYSHIESKNADSLAKKDNFKRARIALINSQKELHRFRNYNLDTSLEKYAEYISLNRDVFNHLLNSFSNDDYDSVDKSIPVEIIDTFSIIKDTPTVKKQILKLGRSEGIGLVSFVDKYPGFGFWYFLSVAQMTMWFLIIALLFGSISITQKIIPDYSYNFKNAIIPFILPGITILLFVIFLYIFLLDRHVIYDAYFMEGFTNKMRLYSTIGYVVAIFCLSTFLFLSNKLELLDAIPKSSDLKAKSEINLTEDFEKLKSAFNFSFLCSAIILSFFVLWLGVLFNSVNEIEAMRYYTLLSGKSFLTYDFVYLIGLLHTLLLIIFYIPVRLRFNALETKEGKDASNNQVAGSKKYFTAFWESLSAVLVTTSPLITSILQNFITSIFQN